MVQERTRPYSRVRQVSRRQNHHHLLIRPVSFRTLLPKDWEWHFVEAEEESSAAPGIEQVYTGPYLTYYSDATSESIENALGLVDDVLENEGPFDGIMGFSQVHQLELCSVQD